MVECSWNVCENKFSSINFESNGTDENNNNDAGSWYYWMAFYGSVSIQFCIDCIWQGWWRFIMMDMPKTLSPKMLCRKTGFFAQCPNRISNSSMNISKCESQSPSPLVLGIYRFRLKNSEMFAIQQKITLAAGYRYRTCQYWTLNKLRSQIHTKTVSFYRILRNGN